MKTYLLIEVKHTTCGDWSRVVKESLTTRHDELLRHGWHIREWTARKGYALTDEAVENSSSETLWCSPNCVPISPVLDLFSDLEAE